MQQLPKGYLITIEGIDGSGKSTLCKTIAHWLEEKSFPVLLTKEPGATALGKHIRTLVQEQPLALCPKAEYLLFASDRAQHIHELVTPALEARKIVISDRMHDSSVAYQGYGRGLDIDMITGINAWAMNGLIPDLSIYVHVSAQTAYDRIMQRNAALTAFEKEKKEFMHKLIHGFDELFKTKKNSIIINGEQSPEEVATQAINAVHTWILSKHTPHHS